MIVRVAFAPRLPGTGISELQREWSGEHAATAARLPGLRRYVQNHAVTVDGDLPLPYPGFDVCAELEFDDPEAMDAALAGEAFRAEVAAAQHRAIDMERVTTTIAERHGAPPPAPPVGAVKLMTFLRAAAGGGDALRDAARETGRETAAAVGALGHEVLTALPERGGPFDAIDVLWLPSVDRALEVARGSAYEGARRALGPLASASERTVARPLTVVG